MTTPEIFSDRAPVGTQQPFNPEAYLTQYLDTEAVAELLHMKVENVRKLLNSGQIRSSFIGRRWLTTRANVETFLQSKAEGGPKAR